MANEADRERSNPICSSQKLIYKVIYLENRQPSGSSPTGGRAGSKLSQRSFSDYLFPSQAKRCQRKNKARSTTTKATQLKRVAVILLSEV
jgi:hypothetical protein